jgi:hypothetical protein
MVKKFSAIYAARRFITVFTRARHWIISWARWIQYPPTQLLRFSHVPCVLNAHLILLNYITPSIFGETENSQKKTHSKMSAMWEQQLVTNTRKPNTST